MTTRRIARWLLMMSACSVVLSLAMLTLGVDLVALPFWRCLLGGMGIALATYLAGEA